jgi:hypothetical protein
VKNKENLTLYYGMIDRDRKVAKETKVKNPHPNPLPLQGRGDKKKLTHMISTINKDRKIYKRETLIMGYFTDPTVK